MSNIDDLMLKPCEFCEPNKKPRLVLIFNLETVQSKYPDLLTGKLHIKHASFLSMVNITETLKHKSLLVEDMLIDDDNVFSMFKIVKDKKYDKELEELANIALANLLEINKSALDLHKVLSIVLQNKHGSLFSMLGKKPQNNIINIYTKNIFKKSPLNESETSKILPKILEVIAQYVDEDLENPKKVEELRKAIEFTIIKMLPASVTVEDIELDMQKILEIIKKSQDNDDSFDDNSTDDDTDGEMQL